MEICSVGVDLFPADRQTWRS